MSDDNPGAAPAVLDQIAHLLSVTPCQHCGRSPYQSEPRHDAASDLDLVGPAERRLWRQADEGAKVRAAAPGEPSPEKIAAARKALTQARRAETALREQIDTAEEALADPRAWLRFSQRMNVAGQLSEDRNAVEPIRAQILREERRVRDLEQQRDRRQAYLNRYRRVLEVSRLAQVELDRRVDELVHKYARLAVPPPWFRLGLGYPPKPDEYTDWLRRARAVVAYRRRYGVDHPLEPLGRGVPPKDTPQYEHWRAAQP
ncbi:MAG: hypothetical protein ACRDUA_04570 [Micromonosporaceae bacterium]